MIEFLLWLYTIVAAVCFGYLLAVPDGTLGDLIKSFPVRTVFAVLLMAVIWPVNLVRLIKKKMQA